MRTNAEAQTVETLAAVESPSAPAAIGKMGAVVGLPLPAKEMLIVSPPCGLEALIGTPPRIVMRPIPRGSAHVNGVNPYTKVKSRDLSRGRHFESLIGPATPSPEKKVKKLQPTSPPLKGNFSKSKSAAFDGEPESELAKITASYSKLSIKEVSRARNFDALASPGSVPLAMLHAASELIGSPERRQKRSSLGSPTPPSLTASTGTTSGSVSSRSSSSTAAKRRPLLH